MDYLFHFEERKHKKEAQDNECSQTKIEQKKVLLYASTERIAILILSCKSKSTCIQCRMSGFITKNASIARKYSIVLVLSKQPLFVKQQDGWIVIIFFVLNVDQVFFADLINLHPICCY